MYILLLASHSLTRWLVLASLLFSIGRAYRGWLLNKPFLRFDNTIRLITVTIAHIQLIIGLWLYGISPVVHYFLHHFHTAVHERQIRFFGMEHITVMLISIVLIKIGRASCRERVCMMV